MYRHSTGIEYIINLKSIYKLRVIAIDCPCEMSLQLHIRPAHEELCVLVVQEPFGGFNEEEGQG